MTFRGVCAMTAGVVACCAGLCFAQDKTTKSDVRDAIVAIQDVAADKAAVGELLRAMVDGGVLTEGETDSVAALLGCRVSPRMADVFDHFYGYEAAFELEGCLPPIQDSVGRVCIGPARCKRPSTNQQCLSNAEGMSCFRNQMAMRNYLACVFGPDWQQPQISDTGWILHTEDLVATSCSGISMTAMWSLVIAPFRGGNTDACECALMNAALESEIRREIDRSNCLQCPVLRAAPVGGIVLD
jgi:hypothetical protein